MRIVVMLVLLIALAAGAVFYFASVAESNAPRDDTLRFDVEIGGDL